MVSDNVYFILAYSLKSQRMKCLGPELNVGFKFSIEKCVEACTGISSLIAYGTNDYGDQGCTEYGCNCRCEWVATYSGECKESRTDSHRLFKIPMKGKYYFAWLKVFGKIRVKSQKAFFKDVLN